MNFGEFVVKHCEIGKSRKEHLQNWYFYKLGLIHGFSMGASE